MEVPKKYWWLVGIAVPVAVATIGIIPQLIPTDGGGETFYVDVVGSQFNGKVAFNNVTIVEAQTRQQLGIELPEEIVETLRKALELSQARNFSEAIPALESVAKAAPVPAVFNNLGAAYLAIGNKERAISSFKKALSAAPDQEAARFNLKRTEGIPEKISEEIEPNNEILNPNTVLLETQIKGTVNEGGDVDYFAFNTPPTYRDVINIEVENRSTSLQPWLRLFDRKKSKVDETADGTPGANLSYSFSAQPDSKHYFFVSGANSSRGDYSVRITPSRQYDQYEPNDQIIHEKSIRVGVPVEAEIMDASDVDYFSFTTSADNETNTIVLENRSTSLQPWLRLFDRKKSKVDETADGTPGANLSYSFSVQPDSKYYFFVNGANSSYSAYTVTVTQK